MNRLFKKMGNHKEATTLENTSFLNANLVKLPMKPENN